MADNRHGFASSRAVPYGNRTRNPDYPRQTGHPGAPTVDVPEEASSWSATYAPGRGSAGPTRTDPRHNEPRHGGGPPPPDDPRSSDQPVEPAPRRGRREDSNPWHWLLLVPIVLPLIPALYNRIEPTLFGLPFFYWAQLAFAFLASGVIALVTVMER
jgi:hypothetical protein